MSLPRTVLHILVFYSVVLSYVFAFNGIRNVKPSKQISNSAKSSSIIFSSSFSLFASSDENVKSVVNDIVDPIYSKSNEPLYSISYDPLEPPNQSTYERDLEDKLLERSLRFYDKSTIRKEETCYLVGLEDRSSFYSKNKMTLSQPLTSSDTDDAGVDVDAEDVEDIEVYDDEISASASNAEYMKKEFQMKYTLEESLTELSELAGAAGLTVVGSTYQRVSRPSIEYYIGQGKTKEIAKTMRQLKCTCVIFDSELTPSQQKNLEMVLNSVDSSNNPNYKIKVIDRTALILDIFAQHARTKEGQLQVQLALLTYRLPRLTNMWTHLERQSAGSKGRSNGGVGLRGPGEKQLETDKRQMKLKISLLNRAIDAVRRHRSAHRSRRRQLGVPVVALVGYTNAGKSSLLNTFTQTNDVFASDMLFATLDPTTRRVSMSGMQYPDMLVTDTVGFIQKLPTNLVAAFRATLEEISEADVLLHVSDVTNPSWRKQEAAVLQELQAMGLEHKPLVRVWNKIDLVTDQKEYWKHEASRCENTVAVSCVTREGMLDLTKALQRAICSTMEDIACVIPYTHTSILSSLHSLGSLREVLYNDEGIFVKGKLPSFLVTQVTALTAQQALAAASASMSNAEHDEEMRTYQYESELAVYSSQVDNDSAGTAPVFAEESSAAGAREEEYFDWTDLAKGRHSRKSNSNPAVSSVSSSAGSVTLSAAVAITADKTLLTDQDLNLTKRKQTTDKKTQKRQLDSSAATKRFIQSHVKTIKPDTISAAAGVVAEATAAYDLKKHGLDSDGLLDFDNGDFGHHGA